LHISPHWNWKEKLGQNIDVWVNTNADNVELVLNGKSLGKKDIPRNSHLNWSVKYEPGVLEAIAIKNGKTLKTKIETTNSPHSIVISPYKTTILADGKDATVLNINVVDKEGREVPDADNLIKFAINGGKIIGVGNGDPSSHEMDKCTEGSYQRALFSGKCQVIIQSNPKAGPIQFDAKANGLVSGSVMIKAQ
jgi:beta-galactosidase